MEKEKDISEYTYPVHRAVMKRQLIMGVPLVPFIIVVLVTIIIVLDFKMWLIIPFAGITIYIMKEITKKDQYLLEVFLYSLLEPDFMV